MLSTSPYTVSLRRVAAQEVARLEPGATVELHADVTAFPTPFSQLKPGRYAVQAVLDRDHSYNYTGRGPGDLVSGVVEMDLPVGAAQLLTLATAIPETDRLQPLSNVPAAQRDAYAEARAHIHSIDFDGAARRLEATMKGLRARTDFRYVEGRSHFDLYTVGDDRWGLYKSIASEMYTVARPGSKPLVGAPVRPSQAR